MRKSFFANLTFIEKQRYQSQESRGQKEEVESVACVSELLSGLERVHVREHNNKEQKRRSIQDENGEGKAKKVPLRSMPRKINNMHSTTNVIHPTTKTPRCNLVSAKNSNETTTFPTTPKTHTTTTKSYQVYRNHNSNKKGQAHS